MRSTEVGQSTDTTARSAGLETANQLGKRGFHVVIGARHEASGKRAVEALNASCGKTSFLRLDVSGSDSIRAAATRFASISDHLDVLINNAGIYPDQGLTILTLPRDRLDQTFQTNAFGPLEVTHAFLPFLRKAGAAPIINHSSG